MNKCVKGTPPVLFRCFHFLFKTEKRKCENSPIYSIIHLSVFLKNSKLPPLAFKKGKWTIEKMTNQNWLSIYPFIHIANIWQGVQSWKNRKMGQTSHFFVFPFLPKKQKKQICRKVHGFNPQPLCRTPQIHLNTGNDICSDTNS